MKSLVIDTKSELINFINTVIHFTLTFGSEFIEGKICVPQATYMGLQNLLCFINKLKYRTLYISACFLF